MLRFFALAPVFLFSVPAMAQSARPSWLVLGNQDDAQLGQSLASAGDVDGDGFADVLVGAPYHDHGEVNERRVALYRGSASGLSSAPSWSAEGDQVGANFGFSVASAGDVNGDGYADVLVGAYLYDDLEVNAGRVFVYHGSPLGLPALPDWTAQLAQAHANFGYSVASAGDVNGDGYSDIVVGAISAANGQVNEGVAFVFHGSPAGLSSVADWSAESNQIDAYLGQDVASAGDVNGDGYSDVVLGSANYDNGQAEEGSAFVFHGSPSGLSASPDWTAESNQSTAYFGQSVAAAGDVNGDGYGDLAVGAAFYDDEQANEGRVFVYHGSPAGLSLAASWTAESDQSGSYFGRVAAAGDVNGDGFADLIVGASQYDGFHSDAGRAFVYRGSASGLSLAPSWSAALPQASALFGWSVSSAGDFDADGYADVLVGGYLFDRGYSNGGIAAAYRGRP